MATLEHSSEATGAPGIAPRWTHSAKDVIGTAYSTASRVWFTVSDGVISEVYFPTLDHPQIRDLQFLVSDGETFLHDTLRDLESSMEYLGEHGLGVRIINADTAGRYRLVIEVITDPHQACLLLDGRLEGDSELLRRLHLYILLAPHIEVAGWGNNGTIARIAGASFSPRTKKAHGWHSPRPRRSRAAHAVTSAPLTDGRIWRTTSEWTTRLPPRLTAISR